MDKDTKRLFKTNFRRRQQIKTAQKLFSICPPSDRFDSFEKSGDIFSSFLYRDHVTRYRYQISKLKNWKKIKTSPDQNQRQDINFYNQELKLLQKIKQNRNKQLASSYKPKKYDKYLSQISLTVGNNSEDIQVVKKKIRKQVLSLNHEFLREYLYHQQPFNQMLVQINEQSNTGIVNQHRINKLKEKIIKCIQDRKKSQKKVQYKEQGTNQKNQVNKSVFRAKSIKQLTQKKIDQKFETIWETLRKQIGVKVKMQGQYNIYKSMKKA